MNLDQANGKYIRLVKNYRNSCDSYWVFVTDEIIAMFGDEDELCEYVGENTNGGHNYGWRVASEVVDTKPEGKELKVATIRKLC